MWLPDPSFLGGRPLLLDGAEGMFCTQSFKGIKAMAVATQADWFEAILDAKRFWFTKY